MKVLFYDAKPYDVDSFETQLKKYPEVEIEFLDTDINPKTARLAGGFDAICAFVSSDVGTETVEVLHECGRA